jgi:DNA-binding beta-propeller fold protein YncE
MVKGRVVIEDRRNGGLEITKTGVRSFQMFSERINISVFPEVNNEEQIAFIALFNKEAIKKQKYDANAPIPQGSQISISLNQIMCVGRIVEQEERASFDDKTTLAKSISEENQDYVKWCLESLIAEPLYTNPDAPIFGETSCTCDIM